MPSNSIFLSTMLISLSVLVLSLAGCSDNKESQSKEPLVRPVKLITVSIANSTLSNRYPAVIDAAQSSSLTFEVGGLVEEVSVREAQELDKGTVIAQLRQRDFRNNLSSAQAQFKNAQDEYQRALRLAKQDAIAKNVLDQRKTQRDVAKSSLDTAKKALEDTVLRAPFAGVVAELPIEELQTVQPGTVVASLINLESLEASIDLPANVIATIEQRQDKKAFVVLDAAKDTLIEATFKEASLIADSISQTYKVVFSFSPPENLVILPGMNATVITQSSSLSEKPIVSLPLAAILSDGGKRFVWVVDQQNMTVSKRAVELEPGIGDSLIVKEGLAEGEVIAGAGAAYLAEGMKIRAWD